MSMSNYLENKVLNHIAGIESYTAPIKCYMALLTSSSTDESTGTEINALGYIRKPITFDASVDGVIKNLSDIVFDVAEENWGVITSVAVFDSETEGNMLFYADLSNPQEVLLDNQMIFKAGKLTISLD